MSIKINSKISFSKEDIVFLSKPLLIFIFSLAVCLVVILIGLDRVKLISKKLKDAEKINSILSQNSSLVSSFNQSVNPESGFEFILPSENAFVYSISQIKNIALESSMIVSDIKVGNEALEGDLKKTQVSFNIQGSPESFYQFIEKLQNSLPLVSINKADITGSGGIFSSDITLTAYSSEFPQKMPGLNDPIKALDAKEADLLTEIEGYSQPLFSAPEEASYIEQRENPFSL